MSWKEEYIKKIGSVEVNELQIEAAQSIKIFNMPEYLYKYRPATDYAISNLETDTVWLNTPSEYNDPFEFVEFLDFSKIEIVLNNLMKDELIATLTKDNPTPEHIKQQAFDSDFPINIIAEYHFKKEGLSDDEVKKIIDVTFGTLKNAVIARNVEKIKSIQEKMKVCSFCESPKQLLMWSHYADYHKGFCIEYNINRWLPNDGRKRILYPVVYQKEFYDFSDHLISQFKTGDFNNLYPIISGSTKSIEWEYEKEWRFIFNIGDSFPKQNYPMDCQTKVFLGSRISNENRERILNICKVRRIEAYDAKPSNERYEMKFELIK